MEIIIPKNITPKEFFENFLPSEYEKIDSSLKPSLIFNAGAEILGQGGGDWSIEYNNGNLKVKRGIPDEPLFTISIKKEQWNKALDNNLTSIFFTTTEIENNIIKLLTQAKIDKLKKEHGKINIKVGSIQYEGETINFEFSLLIGEPLDSDPSLTININQKDFENIKNNPLDLYKLISSQKLNTQGDFRYLMKLATIVFF